MPQPVVRLIDVSVDYANGTRALRGVGLDVVPGERVVLVGRSGAGKSTLLNLLNGRAALDGAVVHGTVEVLGVDPRSLTGRARRRHARRVGTVRQDLDLVGPLAVIHNVNAGRLGEWPAWRAALSLLRPEDRELDGALLEAIGLAPGLLDRRVDELSGGQRQRVAVARVLRQQPELLLADEPVASLDPTLSQAMLELFAAPPAHLLPRGWTSIVSLHQPEFARRFADRIVGMHDGSIVFDEPVERVGDALLEQVYERR